jgi:hypothetical protein
VFSTLSRYVAVKDHDCIMKPSPPLVRREDLKAQKLIERIQVIRAKKGNHSPKKKAA